MSESNYGCLRDGDAVLFVDRKDREYMRTLRTGARVHLRRGTIDADELIGHAEGRSVQNTAGENFLIVRPSYAHLIPNLPRQAQVIYPKDIGAILLWGDIYPGARVVEVGTGPGATTMALLRAVGPTGQVTSYEIREDFVEMARRNVRQYYGEAPNWEIKLRDATTGIDEKQVDRMIIDLAEPWVMLPHAAAAVRSGGILIGYSPTVMQVKQFVDQARLSGFGLVEVLEPFLRTWYVKGLSIRPEHRMVAHTGFVVTARRLSLKSGTALAEIDPAEDSVDTEIDEFDESADDSR